MNFLILLLTLPAAAAQWKLDVGLALPYNFKTPLTIEQSGQPDIEIDAAEYDSHPLQSPQTYTIRVARWDGDKAWELETVHHKIYLQNKPPEVQHFAVSHGYNLFFINRAWKLQRGFEWRLGAGVVITHPENTVRGRKLPEKDLIWEGAYYLDGPALQAGVGKVFPVWKKLSFSAEGKLTAGYAEVNVAGGKAKTPNVAAHAVFGFGWDF